MKLAIGGDHGAYDLKVDLVEHLRSQGHEVVDLGAHNAQRTDYPVYGRAVGEAVVAGEVEAGIALCGSGVGISISANKIRGVRAVLCSEPYSAQMARRHNDANVLCMGGRVVGPELAKMIVDAFLGATFEGGRHADRGAMITALDEGHPEQVPGCAL